MGFFANQTRSVIEWKDADPDLLIWRWNGTNDELKNASKLIINPGQAAIFVYEGQIRAIHDYPGMFELKTANIPFITTLTKIMQNFTSEHKANVYFVRITEFVNQKWGTKAPVKYTDPVYKFPVGMRAFGNFSFHITDVRKFFTEFASNIEVLPISAIRNVIVDRALQQMTDIFATAGLSYAEIDKNRLELSQKLSEAIAPEFAPLGFEMSDFRIENTDFDEKTQERIDKISDKMADAHAINAMGQINTQGLNAYATVEKLNAMNTAAANPNGMAGVGMGMGAGMGLGAGMGMTGGMMGQQATQPVATSIPCGSCGAAMNQNAKFCPDCGKPNTAGYVACIECGAQIKQGAKFCPDCGKPQTANCSKCNASIPGGVKFCPDCGEKIQ
ncbi:MAG: SPFH domain-containing protein [Candidatus Riflebacteria bacterium]|nr:SPFH domain-containing protein [Candidatus Riflebacteria bacterium]